MYLGGNRGYKKVTNCRFRRCLVSPWKQNFMQLSERFIKRANRESAFTCGYPLQRVNTWSAWLQHGIQETKKFLKATNSPVLGRSVKVNVPLDLVPRYHH
ncbi:hypothetical protein I3760_05G112000 [Carya illinoinensis]|nr:hypothetical protein I3760_05G112000 [Carya illinoinensis]